MSVVPAVRAALVTLWTAALTDAPAGAVEPSSRITISPEERLVVGPASGTTSVEALGTLRPVQLDFEVLCTISVGMAGTVDDQPACSARAWALYDAADISLRSVPGENLGLNGVVKWAYIGGDFAETEPPASGTGGKVNTSIEFRVQVSAISRLSVPAS